MTTEPWVADITFTTDSRLEEASCTVPAEHGMEGASRRKR